MISLPPEEFAARLRNVQNMIKGVWVCDALVVLSAGPTRFSDVGRMLRTMEGAESWSLRRHVHIRSGVLASTLQRVVERGLAEREHSNETFPPTSTYWLTPLGEELLDSLVPAMEWAHLHPHEIFKARELELERLRHGDKDEDEGEEEVRQPREDGQEEE
ncbi:winged helix-turn-helix transcriptional regulator [Streptomyces boninensis]|uniref:winged helix-turn-helix transcriptional regulator n=1 Tax=Streptomyces boninensis TaxID=2039455 RepID=UPI003B225F76